MINFNFDVNLDYKGDPAKFAVDSMLAEHELSAKVKTVQTEDEMLKTAIKELGKGNNLDIRV